MTRARIALAAVLALALAAPAAGAAPRTTLPDVEDEVMCVECGTALNISQSPVAEQERAFIRSRIAEGRSKEEIKAALVDEYGPEVLATPEGRAFGAAAWAVPAVLALLAVAGLAFAAGRWRRHGAGPAAAGPALDAVDARRLDADLAAFDR